MGTVLVPTLQTSEMRHAEIMIRAVENPSYKWCGQDSNPIWFQSLYCGCGIHPNHQAKLLLGVHSVYKS